MILDLIVMLCIWFGFMFQIIPMLIPRGDAVFDALHMLPWGFIGVIWLVVGLGIVVWRGKKSKYWMFLDFPVPGTVIDLHVDKVHVIPTRLYKSRIEDLLKTKGGEKYYRDHARAPLFSAGHEVRVSKDGVNHLLDVDDVILTQQLNDMGVTNMDEMDVMIRKQMVMMKETDSEEKETDKYLLTGTTTPVERLDVENNAFHRQVYDNLAKRYSFVLADGGTVSFYQYNNFQKSLGSSTDMASAIDFVRSDEAAKATKIKRGMGTGTWKIVVILGVIILVVVVLAFLLTGGGPPGLIPGQ